MKKIRILVLSVFCMSFALASAKNDKEVIYMFGVSISFNDSTVYFTDIQELDSIELEPKTGFLPHRQHYMYLLKDYLEGTMNVPNRTCMIYFSDKQKSIQKKYDKLKKKMSDNPDLIVTYLKDTFVFTKPDY